MATKVKGKDIAQSTITASNLASDTGSLLKISNNTMSVSGSSISVSGTLVMSGDNALRLTSGIFRLGSRTQTPGGTAGDMFFHPNLNNVRVRFNDGWSELWHSGNLDPSEYLPKSGGTIEGTLVVSSNTTDSSGLYRASVSSSSTSHNILTVFRNNNRRFRIVVESNDNIAMHSIYGNGSGSTRSTLVFHHATNLIESLGLFKASGATFTGDVVIHSGSGHTSLLTKRDVESNEITSGVSVNNTGEAQFFRRVNGSTDGVLRIHGNQDVRIDNMVILHEGNYTKWFKSATLTITKGQTEVTWNHQIGTGNYSVSVVPSTSARHIFYSDKTSNSIKLKIDYPHEEDIHIDVVLVRR